MGEGWPEPVEVDVVNDEIAREDAVSIVVPDAPLIAEDLLVQAERCLREGADPAEVGDLLAQVNLVMGW